MGEKWTTLVLDFSETPDFEKWPEDLLEWNITAIGPMIENTGETPCPWDAYIYVKDGKLILEGGAGPNGYGEVITKVPRDVNVKLPRIIYVVKHEKDLSFVKKELGKMGIRFEVDEYPYGK